MPPVHDNDQFFDEAFQRAHRMLKSGASKADVLSFTSVAAMVLQGVA
jgi:hypothetical protein